MKKERIKQKITKDKRIALIMAICMMVLAFFTLASTTLAWYMDQAQTSVVADYGLVNNANVDLNFKYYKGNDPYNALTSYGSSSSPSGRIKEPGVKKRAQSSVTWPQTTALSTTATAVSGGDADIKFKVSSSNSYTSPLRVYANTTITITASNSKKLVSITYIASSTGNYVTYAQNATVSPSVTPTVSGKNVTWTMPSNTTTFTFKPSSQTRSAGITVTYETPTQNPTITLSPTSLTVPKGGTATFTATPSNYASAPTVTVSSSATGIATVSPDSYTGANGTEATITVTGVSAGSATITVSSGTGSATCSVTVVDQTLTLSPDTLSLDVGGSSETSTASMTYFSNSTPNISFSYSTSGIATASAGTVSGSSGTYSSTITVTPVGAGSTTITVTATGTNGQTASGTITVNVYTTVSYSRVTDTTATSDLVSGHHFIIVHDSSTDYGLTSTTSGNALAGETITISNSYTVNLRSNSDVSELTLGGSNGAWTFKNASNKYLTASGTTGYLSFANSVGTYSTWGVTPSASTTTIVSATGSKYLERSGTTFTTYGSTPGANYAVSLYIRTSDRKTVTSIAVTHAANTLNYIPGETFSTAGLVVTATYSDSTTGDVTSQCSFQLDGSTALTPGETALGNTTGNHTINISYGGQSTSYAIKVLALQSIAVTTNPTKTVYYPDEVFNTTGLVVTGTFGTGGDVRNVAVTPNSIKYNSTTYTSGTTHVPTTAGTYTLTVSYTADSTKTTTFNIKVASVTAITFSDATPNKSVYGAGATIDPAGAALTVTWSDGLSSTVINLPNANVTLCNSGGGAVTTMPDQATFNVYAQYGGQTTDNYMTLTLKALSSITINYAGGKISSTDASAMTASSIRSDSNFTVSGNYTDGTSETIAKSGVDFTVNYDQEHYQVIITATYSGKTASITLDVAATAYYRLVTSKSGLLEGARYIIGGVFDSSGYLTSVGGTTSNTTIKTISVNKSGSYYTGVNATYNSSKNAYLNNEDAMVFTLRTNDQGKWMLQSNGKYLGISENLITVSSSIENTWTFGFGSVTTASSGAFSGAFTMKSDNDFYLGYGSSDAGFNVWADGGASNICLYRQIADEDLPIPDDCPYPGYVSPRATSRTDMTAGQKTQSVSSYASSFLDGSSHLQDFSHVFDFSDIRPGACYTFALEMTNASQAQVALTLDNFTHTLPSTGQVRKSASSGSGMSLDNGSEVHDDGDLRLACAINIYSYVYAFDNSTASSSMSDLTSSNDAAIGAAAAAFMNASIGASLSGGSQTGQTMRDNFNFSVNSQNSAYTLGSSSFAHFILFFTVEFSDDSSNKYSYVGKNESNDDLYYQQDSANGGFEVYDGMGFNITTLTIGA